MSTTVPWPDGGCGNDCDGPQGHREGCPVHCHCFDGADWQRRDFEQGLYDREDFLEDERERAAKAAGP